MKIRGAFVTGRAILSKPDNTLSLIELTEMLTYVGVPEDAPEDATVLAQVTFVALHDATSEEERHAGPVPAKFWIDTPKGRRVEREVAIDFMGSSRSRVLLQLGTLPYAGPGVYDFCFEGPAGIASWSVEVATAPMSEAQGDGSEMELIPVE